VWLFKFIKDEISKRSRPKTLLRLLFKLVKLEEMNRQVNKDLNKVEGLEGC
jgi:hypothetical protein